MRNNRLKISWVENFVTRGIVTKITKISTTPRKLPTIRYIKDYIIQYAVWALYIECVHLFTHYIAKYYFYHSIQTTFYIPLDSIHFAIQTNSLILTNTTPYSGKFWIGANFRIFRMMPRRTKIKSTNSFTLEIFIESNTRVLAKLVGVAFPHAHIRK